MEGLYQVFAEVGSILWQAKRKVTRRLVRVPDDVRPALTAQGQRLQDLRDIPVALDPLLLFDTDSTV